MGIPPLSFSPTAPSKRQAMTTGQKRVVRLVQARPRKQRGWGLRNVSENHYLGTLPEHLVHHYKLSSRSSNFQGLPCAPTPISNPSLFLVRFVPCRCKTTSEGWQSGRMRRTRNPVYGYTVSWVQIPPLPPDACPGLSIGVRDFLSLPIQNQPVPSPSLPILNSPWTGPMNDNCMQTPE